MRSSAHLVDGLLEATAADFVKDSALDDFRALENSLENVAFELEANAGEDIVDLFLGSGFFEVFFLHSK